MSGEYEFVAIDKLVREHGANPIATAVAIMEEVAAGHDGDRRALSRILCFTIAAVIAYEGEAEADVRDSRTHAMRRDARLIRSLVGGDILTTETKGASHGTEV